MEKYDMKIWSFKERNEMISPYKMYVKWLNI